MRRTLSDVKTSDAPQDSDLAVPRTLSDLKSTVAPLSRAIVSPERTFPGAGCGWSMRDAWFNMPEALPQTQRSVPSPTTIQRAMLSPGAVQPVSPRPASEVDWAPVGSSTAANLLNSSPAKQTQTEVVAQRTAVETQTAASDAERVGLRKAVAETQTERAASDAERVGVEKPSTATVNEVAQATVAEMMTTVQERSTSRADDVYRLVREFVKEAREDSERRSLLAEALARQELQREEQRREHAVALPSHTTPTTTQARETSPSRLSPWGSQFQRDKDEQARTEVALKMFPPGSCAVVSNAALSTDGLSGVVVGHRRGYVGVALPQGFGTKGFLPSSLRLVDGGKEANGAPSLLLDPATKRWYRVKSASKTGAAGRKTTQALESGKKVSRTHRTKRAIHA